MIDPQVAAMIGIIQGAGVFLGIVCGFAINFLITNKNDKWFDAGWIGLNGLLILILANQLIRFQPDPITNYFFLPAVATSLISYLPLTIWKRREENCKNKKM